MIPSEPYDIPDTWYIHKTDDNAQDNNDNNDIKDNYDDMITIIRTIRIITIITITPATTRMRNIRIITPSPGDEIEVCFSFLSNLRGARSTNAAALGTSRRDDFFIDTSLGDCTAVRQFDASRRGKERAEVFSR